MTDVFLTGKQLARRYMVHRDTVRHWVEEGKFPEPVKVGGRLNRWLVRDVEEWERKKSKGRVH